MSTTQTTKQTSARPNRGALRRRRYAAYATGPDQWSTYPQCFGPEGRITSGSLVARGELRSVILAAVEDDRAVDVVRISASRGVEHVGSVTEGQPDRAIRRLVSDTYGDDV